MAMCLILCTSQVSVLPKRQDRLSCFLAQKDWTVLHSVVKKKFWYLQKQGYFPRNCVQNSGTLPQTVVNLVQQRWTLSMINWNVVNQLCLQCLPQLSVRSSH